MSQSFRDCQGKICRMGMLTLAFLASFATTAFAGPIDTLQPGYWYEVPNSQLSSVFPNPTPAGSPTGITDAWSGGAYDTTRDRLIVWGGGHSDYAGNEIYVFDINTLKWTRLTDPSTNTGGTDSTGLYPDGLPRANHTYNSLQYLANVDKFVSFALPAVYVSSANVNRVSSFDFNTLQWNVNLAKPSAGPGYGPFSAYNPVTGLAWYHVAESNSGLFKYDPVANKWAGPYGSSYFAPYSTAAIDSKRNHMVTIGGYSGGQVYMWDLNNPGNPVNLGSLTSGDKSIENAQGPGFVYDSVDDKFVAWNGGPYVYILDPVSWVWTKVGPAPGNTVTPPSPVSAGTYGRFRYIPSKNAFILYNHTNQNVYFYKLSAGNGLPPGPTVSLSASPASVVNGASSTLNWSSSNASSCTASGAWSGSKSTSGNQSVGPLSASSTFTLACTGTGGTATRSVSVSVTAPANSAPNQPTVSLPSTVSIRGYVMDVTNGYSDPDGDPLKSSRWQISTTSDFNNLVLDRVVNSATALDVPVGTLTTSTKYWVRTLQTDSQDLSSPWSVAASFTTPATDPLDTDGNGTDDRFQVLGPTDTNNNGIDDSQEGICAMRDAVTGSIVGFKASAGTIHCLTALSTADLPKGVQFTGNLPLGMFSFKVDGLAINPSQPAQVNVTIYLPDNVPTGSRWYKYDEASGTLQDITNAATFGTRQITVHLVDGGQGDEDGTLNGAVVDPSGLVAMSSGGSLPFADTSSTGGGGTTGPVWLLLVASVTIIVGIRRRRAAT